MFALVRILRMINIFDPRRIATREYMGYDCLSTKTIWYPIFCTTAKDKCLKNQTLFYSGLKIFCMV
jgi:hypothetical protein